ncbi:MAG: TolC family protein [Nitrospirota bacterium]
MENVMGGRQQGWSGRSVVALGALWLWLAGPSTGWCQGPGGAAGGESSSPETMSLEQAVGLAMENNRSMQSASLDVDKAADQAAQMKTRRLPALNFFTTTGQLLTPFEFRVNRGAFGTFGATGPIPATDLKITTNPAWTTVMFASVQQPLTQLYRIDQGIQFYEASQGVASEQLRTQRQTVVNSVKRAYFAVLQTQSALDAAEEVVKTYRELDRVVRQQVEQQKALKADSLEVKARLARAEYDAMTIRNAMASQKEQLNVILGRDVTTDFRVTAVSGASRVEANLEEASAIALKQRPEVKAARLKVTQAEHDLRAKKAEYIPDLSLVFDYANINNFNFLPEHYASVGFMFNWEPFDWGRKQRETAEKRKNAQQAVLGVREAEQQTIAEVNSRYRKLQETHQLLQVTQAVQESAREKLRVTMNRYNQKVALLQDVLQAQASLADANNQYSQSLLAYWSAKADFERAIGED